MQARAQRELPAWEVILEQLNWRYATKRYDPSRKISAEDWKALQSALTLAPSSFGLQPYKFIVVEDNGLREKLREAAWDQPQFTDASHLVVFAYKKTLNDADLKSFAERVGKGWGQTPEQNAQLEATVKGAANKAVDGGYMETWNSRQVYIALGFLLETAALLGIDATPMEGFDANQVNKILGLDEYSAVVICALGYRDEDNDWLASKAKVRKDGADLFEIK